MNVKTISRGIAALVMTGAVTAAGMGGTATAATADTINTQCAKQETNLYRCTISGTTTKAVTEFSWSKTPGVSVAYGVYRMASGNGTIEYTPDKIIVRFDEEYAKTHQNLQFSGFTEVRIEAYHHGNDQSITINGTKVNVPGEGYCDEECKNRDFEGLYKSGWDGKDGSVEWGVVLGKSWLKDKQGRAFTITEQPGKGLKQCTFTGVQAQVKNAAGVNEWKPVPAQGIGTDKVTFTVNVEGAHRAFVRCTPEPGATVTENTAVVNGQALTGGWTRKNAGADGDGTMVPPAAPPAQTPPVPGGKLRTPQRGTQLVTETVKVQTDDYLTNTRARKAQVARYDDDRLLHRGEDRRQWGKAKWVLRDVTFQWMRSGDARVDAERRTAALAEAAGVRDRGQVARITTPRKTIVWELRADSWRLDGRVARGTAPQHYLGQK